MSSVGTIAANAVWRAPVCQGFSEGFIAGQQPELEDIIARGAALVCINDYRGISDLRGCSNDVTHMRDIPRRKRK